MTATRLDRWTCPICAWRITTLDVPSAAFVHGTTAHPSTLPARMSTADRLRLIPALANEVAATIGARNPSGYDSDRTITTSAHPRLPIDTAALDALAPDDGNRPWRPLTLLVECSRIVWESIDADLRRRHPQPVGQPTFAGECAWLLRVWDDAQTVLDLADFDWIESIVREIVSTLANLANMTREARFACPDCGEPMHMGVGDTMVCEAGAHTHPGPSTLTREWRRKAPMPAKRLCEELRIPLQTFYSWTTERSDRKPKLFRTNPDDRGAALYLPWDVIALRYPDIVQAADAKLAS